MSEVVKVNLSLGDGEPAIMVNGVAIDLQAAVELARHLDVLIRAAKAAAGERRTFRARGGRRTAVPRGETVPAKPAEGLGAELKYPAHDAA